MGGKKMFFGFNKIEMNPLIIEIDLSKSSGTSFTIPTDPSLGYNYKVDWGDGVKTSGHTSNAAHDYGTESGVFQISIRGLFPKFYFNNVGDKLKIVDILTWGGIEYNHNQSNSFHGCRFLKNIPFHEFLNTMSYSIRMFEDCDSLIFDNAITFGNVTDGSYMFNLASPLTLPTSATFTNLDKAFAMFQQSGILSIPNGVTFANIRNGLQMFYLANQFTTLGNATTFQKLENGTNMLRGTILNNLPNTVRFDKLNNGSYMLTGLTLNTAQYSKILEDLVLYNTNNNFNLNGGLSKYNSSGETARNTLTSSPRNITIIDGGLE